METFLIFCANYLFILVLIFASLYFVRLPLDLQIKMLVLGTTAAIISYGVACVAGWIYFDPRPFVEGHFKPLIPHDAENGFPSDHVLLVSCVASVISVFNFRFSLVLWVLTFLVGYARVYVGVHHFQDIFASMTIAGVVVIVLTRFMHARPVQLAESKLETRLKKAMAKMRPEARGQRGR